MGTVGGNLFAPSPFGDLAVALLALDATVSVMSGYGARDIALEEFLAGRDRAAGRSCLSVSCDRPANPEAFRFRKVARVKPKGGLGAFDRCVAPPVGGRVSARASLTARWRHRDPRQGRGAGARGADAR
jgi:CO/xanthine dehydrogenase FAD-binding subunit